MGSMHGGISGEGLRMLDNSNAIPRIYIEFYTMVLWLYTGYIQYNHTISMVILKKRVTKTDKNRHPSLCLCFFLNYIL